MNEDWSSVTCDLRDTHTDLALSWTVLVSAIAQPNNPPFKTQSTAGGFAQKKKKKKISSRALSMSSRLSVDMAAESLGIIMHLFW